MNAEYNHQYKCQEGQMPEDFENVKGLSVVTYFPRNEIDVDFRVGHEWNSIISSDYPHMVERPIAWMLPEPCKYES